MKIPDSIKILGIPYKIKEVALIDHDVAKQANIDYWQQSITLSSALGPEKKEQAFLHELIHGMINSFDHQFDNEQLVQSLASTLHQVIKENPSLFI